MSGPRHLPPILRALSRRLRARRFKSAAFETEFLNHKLTNAAKYAYIYCWVTCAGWLIFSLTEFVLQHRGLTDFNQVFRLCLMASFSITAVLARRSNEGFVRRHYKPFIVAVYVVIALSNFVLEYKSQVMAKPAYFYLSVSSLCVILVMIAYGFLRLDLLSTVLMSVFTLAAACAVVYVSGAFDTQVLSRMVTYFAGANIVGLILHRIFDAHERWMFIQTIRLRRMAILKRKLDVEAAISEAKTRFLAVLSHDIRTPMNGIKGLVEQLDANGAFIGQNKILANGLNKACDQLLATLTDVLDYAEARHGHPMTIRQDFFCLDTMIQDIAQMFQASIRAKVIAFKVNIDAGGATQLLGDKEKLSRVLINLVSNAIKFSSPGGQVNVSACVEKCAPSRAQVRIAVQDNGSGIPPEAIDKIFQPFYQGDAPGAAPKEGHGLGLAICSQIINAMHGSIHCVSRPGATCFTVELELPTMVSIGSPAKSAPLKPAGIAGAT